jgi:hypothetical protein
MHFGIQETSSQTDILDFSMPFGLHFGRRWTPNLRNLKLSIHRWMGGKSSEQDIGSAFEGLQSKSSKDLRQKFDLYLALL